MVPLHPRIRWVEEDWMSFISFSIMWPDPQINALINTWIHITFYMTLQNRDLFAETSRTVDAFIQTTLAHDLEAWPYVNQMRWMWQGAGWGSGALLVWAPDDTNCWQKMEGVPVHLQSTAEVALRRVQTPKMLNYLIQGSPARVKWSTTTTTTKKLWFFT